MNTSDQKQTDEKKFNETLKRMLQTPPGAHAKRPKSSVGVSDETTPVPDELAEIMQANSRALQGITS